MYSEDRARDLVLAARAITTNLLARSFPGLYVRLTRQTGRGSAPESPAQLADYFLESAQGYLDELCGAVPGLVNPLAGKRVAEYGPGSIPGAAFALLAMGASQVDCFDRFPMLDDRRTLGAVFEAMIGRMPPPVQARARAALPPGGEPGDGRLSSAVSCRVTRNGLIGASAAYDYIFSRAVLEHVDDLASTFRDMAHALRPGGVAVHLVDLRSHGLDRHLPLDFLTWPDWLYRLMYGDKGFPNRYRLPDYQALCSLAGLQVCRIRVISAVDLRDIQAIRPFLPGKLRPYGDEALSCTGFWLVVRRQSDQAIAPQAHISGTSG